MRNYIYTIQRAALGVSVDGDVTCLFITHSSVTNNVRQGLEENSVTIRFYNDIAMK